MEGRATFNRPWALAFDPLGNLYMSEYLIKKVRRIVNAAPVFPFPPPLPLPPYPPPPDLKIYVAATVSPVVCLILIGLLILLVLRITFNLRAKTKAEEIGENLSAPALVPPLMDSKRMDLDRLPNIISAQHFGMPADLANEDMRLLLIESVMTWANGIMVYEDVPSVDYVKIPYGQVTADQWAQTVVLTWRW